MIRRRTARLAWRASQQPGALRRSEYAARARAWAEEAWRAVECDLGTGYGGYFQSDGSNGTGVYGKATATTGNPFPLGVGVRGESASLFGAACMGLPRARRGEIMADTLSRGQQRRGIARNGTATSGTNYGVRGQTSSANGYAGYFLGRGYFSGNVGIGVSAPAFPLDVSGLVRSSAGGLRFRMAAFKRLRRRYCGMPAATTLPTTTGTSGLGRIRPRRRCIEPALQHSGGAISIHAIRSAADCDGDRNARQRGGLGGWSSHDEYERSAAGGRELRQRDVGGNDRGHRQRRKLPRWSGRIWG